MVSYVKSACVDGIDGKIVEVETYISNGLPCFDLIGLSGKVANEAKERVRSAIKNSGFMFPMNRITVNIFPAEMRKEGSQFDLAIAMGILSATRQITMQKEVADRSIFIGELTLDGRVNHVTGVIPVTLEALKNEFSTVIVPERNAKEALVITTLKKIEIKKLKIIAARNLIEASTFAEDSDSYDFDVRGLKKSREEYILQNRKINDKTKEDFKDIKGHKAAKRAFEIAAAGNHNCIILGSPGSGKSMLAKRIPGILPEMIDGERLETGIIYSIAGMIKEMEFTNQRPFRAPHHGITAAALVGGGVNPRPGEISLAHNGVLFLDEICEFDSVAIDMLREPLESGQIIISRKNNRVLFPSRFMLVAAANPCKCGMLLEKKCCCTARELSKYQNKLSGAIMDRIDIRIEVATAGIKVFNSEHEEESSEEIRSRVNFARMIQLKRFENYGITSNSQMNNDMIREFVLMDAKVTHTLERYERANNLSLRGCVSILKVARTIADLNGGGDVNPDNIAEAILYRVRDSV